MTKNKVFNYIVTLMMVALTVWGSMQNGWINLANLVSYLGLIGVVGLASKWQGNFWFNGAQNIFAAIMGARAKLFGDMFMSLFYLGSQVYGSRNWKNNRVNGKLKIEQQSNWRLVIWSIVIGFVLMGSVSWILGGAFIILDALNNSTAIVAQVLQMRRVRAGWLLWLFTNVLGVIIWAGVGQPQMAIMYVVFSLNSLRGYINWGEEKVPDTVDLEVQ